MAREGWAPSTPPTTLALDCKIALKFRPALTDLTELAIYKVLKKKKLGRSAMAKVSHPNVVTVHDVGVFEGKAYLAMEFVDGTTLSAWRTAQPRSIREICRVLAGGPGAGRPPRRGVERRLVNDVNA